MSTETTPAATAATTPPPPAAASTPAPAEATATATTTAAQDGKETAQAAPAETKQDAADKPTETKPDAGDIEVKLADGVTVDEAILTEFKQVAKELGLKSEGAQKLVDLQSRLVLAAQESARIAWEQQVEQWKSEVKADKDVGGAKYDESVAAAGKVMARYFDNEFRQFLNSSALGNHPAMVRAFVRIGRELSEDSIAGTATGGTPPPAGDPFLGIYKQSKKEQ